MRMRSRRRAGLSLLEVILAMIVLATAMMMLGQLLRIGGRNATVTHELSRAQMHAQSIMSQLAAGVLETSSVQQAQIEADPEWLYSVEVESMALEGLLSVRVTVEQAVDQGQKSVETSLVRWMLDREYIEQLIAAAEAAAEEAAAAEEEASGGA